MKQKLLILIALLAMIGIISLEVMEYIHIALAAVLVLFIFIVTYSYTTKKDRDIPKDIHSSFENAFEYDEVKEEQALDFLEKKTKVCPVCNTENIINRKYCKKCNTFIQNITCPVCSTINPHTAKYCENCDSILQNKTRS